MDSGASKSCINSSLPVLTNIDLKDSKSKLLCANGDLITSSKQVSLDMRVGNLSDKQSFIVVPNLSADVILGMDMINSLEFTKSSDSIVLNGEILPLVNKQMWKYGVLCSNTITQPLELNHSVQIKNPFQK